MRKYIYIITGAVFCANIIAGIILPKTASAYWVWTPETKKFINPKYAVKDSPKEQFDWAMSFYDAKDYQKAAAEFEKLTKQYEYSEYASKAQYYAGLCYENMGKPYIAFQNYQKAIDNFPHIDNIDEIIARQFNIAAMYELKDSPKVLGTDIMTSLDRSIEIYKKVVDNAPYGKLADEAQFKMGEAMKKSERYDEAISVYQKIIDEYPNSRFFDRAKYEVAFCAYKASLKPAYDVGPTDKAIKAFEDFTQSNQDNILTKEAETTVQRLRDKSAEKVFETAKFYENQGHHQSAIIYYQEVIDKYNDTSLAKEASVKIEKLNARLSSRKSKENAKTATAMDLTQFWPKKEKAPKKIEKPKEEEKKAEVKKEEAAYIEEAPKPEAPKAEPATPVVEKVEPAAEPAKVEPPAPVAVPETVKLQEEPVVAAPKAEKKGWAPLNFSKKSEEDEKEEDEDEEEELQPVKPKKAWAPFSFSKRGK